MKKIAVDVGGTYIRAALIDEANKMTEIQKERTVHGKERDELLDQIEGMAMPYMEKGAAWCIFQRNWVLPQISVNLSWPIH